jgi:membrane protein DedA with SNARE-associated domain
MSLEHVFAQYGYAALLFGSLADGTPVMLFGGFAAHRGWLQLLPWVIVAGAAGNFLASAGWFVAIRALGEGVLDRRPKWAAQVARVRPLLQRWGAWLILGIRFLPGLSLGGLIAVALSGISLQRFLVLNTVAALAWAAAFGTLGYLLGDSVERLLGEIERSERPVALALLGSTVLWIGWRQTRQWRRTGAAGRAP